MISAHLPILQVVIPLMAAPICVIVRKLAPVWIISIVASWLAFIISLALLNKVALSGAISYNIGDWLPPWGIEYKVDILSALVLTLVSGIGAAVMIFAPKSIEKEVSKDRIYLFYTMYLLTLAGLLGITITGDAFNLFVFLEISSLSTYVLISLGKSRKAITAAFRYLILGTIGATFYVIGVGLLYQMTGTLNMADLAQRLPPLAESKTLLVAIGFITVGIGLKLGLFPLHTWLPNAYTYAPSIVTVFLAATATKVAIYALLRIYFSIFGVSILGTLPVNDILLCLGTVSILSMSIVSIFQTNIKRLLAYSSVAQVGYIVMGIGIATKTGIMAAILHTFNHGIMKGCLFLAVASLFYRIKSAEINSFAGLGKQMPLTMAAFMIGGLSLIGLPLTVGFISKWYLVLAMIEEGWWILAILILVSSLLAIVYIWKIIEVAYFQPMPNRPDVIKETSYHFQLPLWLLAAATIYFGVNSEVTVSIADSAAKLLIGGLK